MAMQYGLSLSELAEYFCGDAGCGFSDAEILAAEKRVGVSLPAVYRDYLRTYGANPIHQAHNHLNIPEEITATHQVLAWVLEEWREDYEQGEMEPDNPYYLLFALPEDDWNRVTGNYVLIWYENQGVWNAGYLLDDLREGKADPPVYISTEDDFITFASTGLNTEGFLRAMFPDAAWSCKGRRLQKAEEIDPLLQAEGVDKAQLAQAGVCLDTARQKLFLYESASSQLTVVQKNAEGQWVDLTPAAVSRTPVPRRLVMTPELEKYLKPPIPGGIGIDPLLAEAIFLALGRVPTIPYDLAKIKSLQLDAQTCPRNLVKSPGGLSFAAMRSLPAPFYYALNDWSALGRMPNLRRLIIREVHVEDWSFLPSCVKVEKLSLDCTNFSDCSLLAKMPELKSVSLYGCRLTNEGAIAGLHRV